MTGGRRMERMRVLNEKRQFIASDVVTRFIASAGEGWGLGTVQFIFTRFV